MKIFNFSIFQILIAVLSVSIIFSRVIKILKKERGQTFVKLFLTVFVWLGILIFDLFPDMAKRISVSFGMGENLNTLIFLVFVVIFLLLFKLINIIEKIERYISEIVREEALKKIKENDGSDGK